MNSLTSQQRKVVYVLGILALVFPIIWLGQPATGEADPAGRQATGGRLAQLRTEYDLGESNLGNVDPSSATMNLVLLGLRGLATNLLWMEHDKLKTTKNWAQMRTTTESIIMLQPHFLQVWRYHGWDLAYNVSAEWDGVGDRYYWVKEGIKFVMKGTTRNETFTDLYFDSGTFLGQKVGRSDEWRFFRKFFNPAGYPAVKAEDKGDPDPRFKGGPDPDINPEGKDNYLAAKVWYTRANEYEPRYKQHIMARELFRAYPSRSTMDYADALNREGIFDNTSRQAWQNASHEWVTDYGQMLFPLTRDSRVSVFLEMTEEDIQRVAQQAANVIVEPDRQKTAEENSKRIADVTREIAREINQWLKGMDDICHYRYWRTRAQFESESEAQDAHRELYDGEQHFANGDVTEAQKSLESGLKRFSRLLERYSQESGEAAFNLSIDDNMIEEGLSGVLLWKKCLQLQGLPVPDEYPLKQLWEKEIHRVPELQADFNRRFGGGL